MPQTQENVRQRVRIIEPDLYDVVFLNDDFTTQDFVVDVLVQVFFKSDVEAFEIMMQVHINGSGVAGTYTYDTAASKTRKAIAMARREGFPLRINVTPHK